jgi:mediator of RNA polymerase II transcription subunit 14
MPGITFKLSALLPEMVFQPKGRPSALGQDLTNLEARNAQAGMPNERITTAMSLSSKQPWANDFVALDFQGVQTPTHTSTDGNDTLSHALLCVSTATISVRNPSKIKGLSGKVDRDVSYDPAHGRFRLRMRHAVGVSILPLLKSRLQAIDRFVSFLQAFDDAHGTMTSHSATLNEVSCFYSDAAPTETEGNTDSAAAERWKVVMDLSGNEIQVRLEKDNPHLRVIDLITRLVNFDGGIRSLMIWLPSSLPALRAISEIESRWEEIQDRAQGNVEFSIRQLDWMGIRYNIHTTDGLGLKETKQLQLDCRLRLHKEEPWWHLCRSDEVGTDDPFNTALQTIWNNKGEDWLGLSTGAAGKLSGGVGKMLDAVDEAVRAMVGTIGGEQDALLIP